MSYLRAEIGNVKPLSARFAGVIAQDLLITTFSLKWRKFSKESPHQMARLS